MAKNNSNTENTAPVSDQAVAPPEDDGFMMNAPEGAKKVNTRSEGFWDEAGNVPICGKLLFAREFIPQSGPSKGKTKQYYVLQLTAKTKLAADKRKNKPASVGNPGQLVGVMATPGLADLKMLAGCILWIKRNPESEYIDTGMPSKMKTYDVRRVEGKGEAVKVLAFDANREDEEEQKTAELSDIPF